MSTEDDNTLDSNELEIMAKMVEARSHPLKAKLLQLLSIYSELSAADLVDKTGKTKPTLLKHLDELENLGELVHREEISPGMYNRKLYSLTRKSWTIAGQELRERIHEEPEFALMYTNYQLSQLLLFKDIIDSMVEYQQRLNVEVENAVQQNNGNEILELMKDHLGMNTSKYMTRSAMMQEFQDVSSDEPQIPDNQPKTHLKLELMLPIRRIIEQLAKDEWEKAGNLWF